ncbi:MAG: hypothetical protein JWP81_1795 [Ferruginibacter sp.]|nr:hypothetical protein [Ferruginibacter sp.]
MYAACQFVATILRNMTHVINKLRFEVECPHEDYAFSMRQNFAQTYQLQIAEIIDRVCNKYVSDNEWIRIGELEIDLGLLSPSVFDREFEKIFLDDFEKKLLQKLGDYSIGQRKASEQKSKFELLQFFLQKGMLPWWGDETTTNLEELTEEVFSQSGEEISRFLHHKKDDKLLWRRIAFQFSAKIKQEVIELFKELSGAVAILEAIKQNLSDEIKILQSGNLVVVENAVNKVKEKCEGIIIVDMVIANAPIVFNEDGNFGEIKDIFHASIMDPLRSSLVQYGSMNSLWEEIVNGLLPSTIKSNQAMIQSSDDTGTPVVVNENKDVTEYEALFSNNDAAETDIGKIIVRNAGIILLAPFFKQFFTTLGLLKGNDWMNTAAQVKAVYLLKYVSSGPGKHYEYHLVLEKLLCGMPVYMPIPQAPELSKEEINEADSLLRSVIEHWKVLKNTTINALRESFLKRDGIITARDNNWQLQIERKTMDVLLGSIPWGYATISLPWNQYIIFTEW